jgi:hypothetical protein
VLVDEIDADSLLINRCLEHLEARCYELRVRGGRYHFDPDAFDEQGRKMMQALDS